MKTIVVIHIPKSTLISIFIKTLNPCIWIFDRCIKFWQKLQQFALRFWDKHSTLVAACRPNVIGA